MSLPYSPSDEPRLALSHALKMLFEYVFNDLNKKQELRKATKEKGLSGIDALSFELSYVCNYAEQFYNRNK